MNKYKILLKVDVPTLNTFATTQELIIEASQYKTHGKFIDFFDEIVIDKNEEPKVRINKDRVVMIMLCEEK